MPTPTNYNNIAYARQYKLINLHKGEDKVVNGDKGVNDYYHLDNSVKGSIALETFVSINENNYVPTFSPVLGGIINLTE